MMGLVDRSNRLHHEQSSEAKEKMQMRKVQTPLWLVIVGAVLLVLLVGAVAWAATWAATNDDDERGPGLALGVAPGLQGQQVGPMGMGPMRDALESRRDAIQERRQQMMEHRKDAIEGIRDEMSPEDQEQYDQLTASIEAQRDGLEAARQGLADTLKEFRALIEKYLDAINGPDEGGDAGEQ
jgi:uncharacterized membrane protein